MKQLTDDWLDVFAAAIPFLIVWVLAVAALAIWYQVGIAPLGATP